MHHTRRIPIAELNEYLTCKLCKGYFIDATTIIECLHTFCRSCIVRCLEKNKYCPVCDVQVHKTKPLLNIRPDKTLQDIVYKLVPRLFQDEMCRRREFYANHVDAKPTNLEQCGEASYQHILSPDETICLSFNYHGSSAPPRFLRCSAAVSVVHLQKLLRSKYDLSDHHRIDILYNQDCLNARLALMDIAYMYLWKRKEPLELTYRIYENTSRKQNLDLSKDESSLSDGALNKTKSEWKEVQLRISENGEMCFTGIDDCIILNDQITKCIENNCNEEEKKEVVTPISSVETPSLTTDSKPKNSQTPTTSTKESNSSTSVLEVTTAPPSSSNLTTTTTSITCAQKVVEKQSNGKHKLKTDTQDEPSAKQPKQVILNNSLGLHNLSNNHPLKRHSQVRKSVENDPNLKITTTVTTSSISIPISTSSVIPITATKLNPLPQTRPNVPPKWPHTKTPNLPCYVPKTNYNPVINVPKVQPSTSRTERSSIAQTTTSQTAPIMSNKVSKSKPNNPIGYKTLRDPPKTWNPQISRASLLKSPDSKFGGDMQNVKPAKFFKMRNNMPRYLGNPASGVKPLFQVHNVGEKETKSETITNKSDKTEIKKHSIVKIDPKTLKPISEKAPETSNLTNQIDLKINTSSVPIFNPLKLQSSPKNDRKSPKSPQSPKSKSSPPNKRDKLNLNYTPPNPFIPNLTNPTLNPNQFLYPSGPPGFPPYDPHLVAAYHSLFYGQPMPFSPNHLNLDLNRKNFDSPAPTSPKIPALGQFSPKCETKSIISEPSQINSTKNSHSKRIGKESTKNEKSLQNAVEKLTQNRVKELTKKEENSSDNNKGIKADSVTIKNGNAKTLETDDSNKKKSDTMEAETKKKCSETKQLEKSDNKSVSNNNNNTDSVSLITDANKK